MDIIEKRNKAMRRAFRVRNKIRGTAERPRLSVFRSLRHISAQLIDDLRGVTLAACSTQRKDIASRLKTCDNKDAAKLIGAEIAKLAVAKGITAVAFDRGAYKYHGRVKALAEAAREAGLKF